MSKRVTIIDYGLGNIFSVSRAVEHFGAVAHLTDSAAEIMEASWLILPGVGAFENGMKGLRERGLADAIKAYAASGRPLLGICLGMQMLVTQSLEFGTHEGLNIIPGRVLPISGQTAEGTALKVPHIGWSPLKKPTAQANWSTSILSGIAEGTEAYFVHSYTVVPDSDEHRLADAYYGSCRVSAAIQNANVIGCQFHPEKSGPKGLKMIENFLSEQGVGR